jgi:hypothetical protein
MGLSSDEERILSGIQQRLTDDDPAFAHRAAALRRRMHRRQILFYETLSVLIIAVAALIAVAILATTSRGAGPDPSERPFHQVTASQETFTVSEPP